MKIAPTNRARSKYQLLGLTAGDLRLLAHALRSLGSIYADRSVSDSANVEDGERSRMAMRLAIRLDAVANGGPAVELVNGGASPRDLFRDAIYGSDGDDLRSPDLTAYTAGDDDGRQ